MELTDWKTLYKIESFGKKNYGIEIRVAVDRPLNQNDEMAMYDVVDRIEKAVLGESMRLDPEEAEKKEEERTKLIALFGDAPILVREIPNGYCSRWCCTQKPWYSITTKKGVVTLGWRKRVIEIAWEKEVNTTAQKLFPDEDVTRIDRLIHAWGYEKAQEYLTKILS